MKHIATSVCCVISFLSVVAESFPEILTENSAEIIATDEEPGQKAGFLSDSQYSLIYDEDKFAHILWNENGEIPRFNISLLTSVACRGLTARLEVDNGYSSTFSTLLPIDPGEVSPVTLIFDEPLVIGPAVETGYTLTVIPNFEGADPTAVRGCFVKGVYPAGAVMEEFTGTWCGYCPRGAAYLSYYSDMYGMAEGKGRFIGMAIHSDDVMEPPFFSGLSSILPTSGYPYAYLNRSVGGDPSSMPVVSTLESKSIGDLKISRVDYDSSSEDRMRVHYGTALCYDTERCDLNISAYVIEDDVRSSEPGYRQTNNFSGYSESEIASRYGNALVPYFDFYRKMPKEIPASRMTYNEVASAAFPSAKGEPIGDSYRAFVFNVSSLEMEMPRNVMNRANTAIVLLLTDSDGKNVVSADIVRFADYNKDLFEFTGNPVYPEGYDPILNSVKDVRADVTVRAGNGVITVTSSAGADITVTSFDGYVIYHDRMMAGTKTIRPGVHGPMIVRAVTDGGTKILKTIL